MTNGQLSLAIMAALLSAVLAAQLWRGRAVGRWPADRQDEPIFYWSVAAFYAALIIAALAIAFAL